MCHSCFGFSVLFNSVFLAVIIFCYVFYRVLSSGLILPQEVLQAVWPVLEDTQANQRCVPVPG